MGILDRQNRVYSEENEEVQKKPKTTPISLNKLRPLKKGMSPGILKNIRLVEDKPIKLFGKHAIRDIMEGTFDINGNIRTKDMFPVMSENSELGKLIEAVLGYIPDHVEDLESEIVGKEVGIIIDTNTDVKGKVHYNIVGFESIKKKQLNSITKKVEIVAEENKDEAYLNLEDIDLNDTSDLDDLDLSGLELD